MGANDRIVVLEVPCEGGHWQPVMWRNAVTIRRICPTNAHLASATISANKAPVGGDVPRIPLSKVGCPTA